MKITKTFSIEEIDWFNLEETAKKLGYESRNKLIQSLVKNILYGDDIKTEDTIKRRIEEEKLQALKNKNELHGDNKLFKHSQAKIKEYHANHLGTIGSNPSPQAKKAMTHYVNGTQPYDENAIYCPECKFRTNSKDSISWQIDRLTDHMRNFHKRNFTEDEAKIISELLI